MYDVDALGRDLIWNSDTARGASVIGVEH